MLDKLEMFIAVAKEAHFGRAAASLGITQPTLSTGIKLLEEQLGAQLVFRSSRYGGLTPEGQTALVWARKIVGDARQLREEMRFKREGLSGQLRLAVIPTALTWVARLASEFGEKHPNVGFTILSRTSAEILSMLDNLEIDAGISYLDNEPMGRVSTEPLYEERYMLVCARSSPFSKRDSVGWDEIGGARLCLLTPDMQNRRIINRNFAAADTTPEPWIEFELYNRPCCDGRTRRQPHDPAGGHCGVSGAGQITCACSAARTGARAFGRAGRALPRTAYAGARRSHAHGAKHVDEPTIGFLNRYT